jgi:hypothetical protein
VNGQFKQLGRIRGTASQDEGGWGDDFPPYPDPENYGRIAEAFKPYPYYNPAHWIRDRRGLSYHQGQYGEVWTSKPLADPADFDLKGFKGWTQKNKKGIADFYSAVALPDNRALVKVFWKEKDRLIDRTAYGAEDIDIRRRFRFTGETTIVPAVIEHGELRITSTKSVIPHDYHARKAHPEVHWATKPERIEVGQMTPANRVIQMDGYTYIIYGYRDDVHYENLHHDNDRIRHHAGIFVHRMKNGAFDALFK